MKVISKIKMEKGITKKEKDYLTFNIRGFFRHYKIEQNINKISIDISNLQKLTNEVNNLLNDINIYKEELNSINLLDNQANRTRLIVNRRHKIMTKSTDTATRKIVENKQKIKLKDLKYDLNKSNMTLRPKTPDVSKIFNKYKKKKYNTNINKQEINDNKYNKIGSISFVQTKKLLNKNKENNISKTNTMNNSKNNISDINNYYNRTQYKPKRDNSFDNKEKENLNYTMTKLTTDYKQKNIKKLNMNNKINDLSPNKIIKKEYDNNLNNIKNIGNVNNKVIKTKKLKKLNIYNKYLNERFHSSDVVKRKTNNEQKKNIKININKKINKKTFKYDFNKRMNAKTPSPINYRQSSPLLIDHDTIIRNKNKKINYNGNYYNEHLYNNKIIKKKISNPNFNKKQKNNHLKIKSDEIIIKKDITKEEEKKLDEHIINSNINNEEIDNNQKETQINTTKNIMDISQKILKNLEYMNNLDINKEENNFNIMNISEINKYKNYNNNDKKIKNRDNLFMSKYIESLYLSIKLGFFEPSEKLKLLLISKELNFKFKIKDVVIDYINYYEKQILLINNKIKKYEINKINKVFSPRKTGLNSLNFITKNEEQRLINEPQHEYVIKIFKIILIFLNEYNIFKDKENENDSKMFEYLFNEIYKKYNVNNIKDLFINNFVDKVPIISDIQFNKINEIINEIPELLSPSTLLAYNRNVSYLTFFLSELYNYFSMKTNDGVEYYKIRNDLSRINQYINKINKLKIYL